MQKTIDQIEAQFSAKRDYVSAGLYFCIAALLWWSVYRGFSEQDTHVFVVLPAFLLALTKIDSHFSGKITNRNLASIFLLTVCCFFSATTIFWFQSQIYGAFEFSRSLIYLFNSIGQTSVYVVCYFFSILAIKHINKAFETWQIDHEPIQIEQSNLSIEVKTLVLRYRRNELRTNRTLGVIAFMMPIVAITGLLLALFAGRIAVIDKNSVLAPLEREIQMLEREVNTFVRNHVLRDEEVRNNFTTEAFCGSPEKFTLVNAVAIEKTEFCKNSDRKTQITKQRDALRQKIIESTSEKSEIASSVSLGSLRLGIVLMTLFVFHILSVVSQRFHIRAS